MTSWISFGRTLERKPYRIYLYKSKLSLDEIVTQVRLAKLCHCQQGDKVPACKTSSLKASDIQGAAAARL